MYRKTIDHTEERKNSSYRISNRKLYIFYQKGYTKRYIVIYANAYLEAIELLYSFNNYASYVYNLNEYKLQHVNEKYLFDICKIEPDYQEIPNFVSKSNYKKLSKYIVDKEYSKINHTKVLTNDLYEKLNKGGLN